MRILVIEDEDKIAQFIRRGLREEGYAVDIAHDGEEGHYLASTHYYDLLLLDVMPPKLNGIELCKRLRSEGFKTPVMILSAKGDVEDKVSGLDCGANDYLTKPFAFEELSARVRAHLRRGQDDGQTSFQVGDLMLDTLTQKVTRGDREISLTAKEYSLLSYLMRHVGQVITRTMLAEHVWDLHFDASSNVIDVYINYLRNKIDNGHTKKLIHTLRGRGYMIKL